MRQRMALACLVSCLVPTLRAEAIWLAGGSGQPRADATATLTNEGKVVVAGGSGLAGALSDVEVYDPVSDTYTTVAGLSVARTNHTASLLHDGSLIVVGGRDLSGSGALTSCERSRDGGKTFQPCADLATARFSHTATVLRDGRLLVIGGYDASGVPLSSAEIFDPMTGSWSAAGTLVAARARHAAVLLPSDEVLVLGGADSTGSIANVETWTGASGFSAAGMLLSARADFTATLLYDGTVLIVGGETGGTPLPLAEIYDPALASSTSVLASPAARTGHQATLLPNGQVLLSGGTGANGLEAVAEIYDPFAGSFVGVGALGTPRTSHEAVLLPSGQVLVLGGLAGTTYLGGVERYRPGTPGWSGVASMNDARDAFGLVRFDGRVVALGGTNGNGDLDTAEVYDAAADTWSATSKLPNTLVDPEVVAVGGEVFVAGGDDGKGPVRTALRWSPSTRQWTQLASMQDPRLNFGLVALSASTLLAVGGDDGNTELDTVEAYDVATDTWSSRAKLGTARRKHRALRLADGRVLVAGGKDNNGRVASAEVYDPASNAWSSAGSMRDPRTNFTVTLLADGRVLVAGGDDGNNALARCDVYDPQTNSWSATGDLGQARFDHVAVRLVDGRVLVAGGDDGNTALASAEVWDPATGTWTTVQPLATARRKARAVVLADGRVLVAGGKDNNGELASAEVYDLGSGGPAIWAPTLDPVTASTFPGAVLTLTGSGLTGVSEASGGGTAASPGNAPLVRLTPAGGGPSTWAPVRQWNDTTIEILVPGTLAQGSYDLQVVVAGSPSAAQPLTVGAPPPGPVKIGILTPPQTLQVGSCSAPVVLELQDGNGVALADLTKDTVLSLSSLPNGLAFFSDPSCTNAISSLTIPRSQTNATFYFSGSVVGQLVLYVQASGLASATQTEVLQNQPLGALVFQSAPASGVVGSCLGPFVLETHDASGAVQTVGQDLPITLSSTLSGLGFYGDTQCQTDLGGVTRVGAGTSQVSVWVLGRQSGSGAVQAVASGYQSASSQLTLDPGLPDHLVVQTAPVTIPAGTCGGPVTVALEDALGNGVFAATDVTLDLSARPSTTLVFSTASDCSVPVTSAILVAGTSSVSLYFQDDTAGAVTLSFQDSAGTLGSVEQTETVTPAGATALGFVVEPSVTAVGTPIQPPVEVEVRDALGNRVLRDGVAVTVGFGANPSGANLGGTTTQTTVAGIATFPDLVVDSGGVGFTLVATAVGLTQAESSPFDVTGGGSDVDLDSPVSANTTSAEACASQDVWVTLTVEPRTTGGMPLGSGHQVSIVEDPPYIVQGAVRELPGVPVRYEVEVGSNRCGDERAVQVQVDGQTLATEVPITFTCPAVQSSGVSFRADPAEVPADGESVAAVIVTVVDRCGNPAFGRRVRLDPTELSLAISIDPEQATTSDTPGTAGDGAARFELVSDDAGQTGVAAHVDGVTAVSDGQLVTFTLQDVLEVTLSASKQRVSAGDTVDLTLALESRYAGRLQDLVVTPALDGLTILDAIGADLGEDGRLRLATLRPRGRAEVTLTVQVQVGRDSATASASVDYGAATGGERKQAISNTVSLQIVSGAASGCECDAGPGAPARPALLLVLVGVLFVSGRRRHGHRAAR